MVAFELEVVVVEMHDEHARRSPRVMDEHAQAAMVAWVVMFEQFCGCARVSLPACQGEGGRTVKSCKLVLQVDRHWVVTMPKISAKYEDDVAGEASARLTSERTLWATRTSLPGRAAARPAEHGVVSDTVLAHGCARATPSRSEKNARLDARRGVCGGRGDDEPAKAASEAAATATACIASECVRVCVCGSERAWRENGERTSRLFSGSCWERKAVSAWPRATGTSRGPSETSNCPAAGPANPSRTSCPTDALRTKTLPCLALSLSPLARPSVTTQSPSSWLQCRTRRETSGPSIPLVPNACDQSCGLPLVHSGQQTAGKGAGHTASSLYC